MLGDAKAGEGKAAACGACHGMDGNPADKQYPKLAGQNEAYVARQITLFKTQKRQNADHDGLRRAALASRTCTTSARISRRKTSLPGVADEKLLERGQALYRGGDATLGVPACMACHGPDGRGMAGAGYPQLAGQWADYVAGQAQGLEGRHDLGRRRQREDHAGDRASASAMRTSRRSPRTSRACTPRRRDRRRPRK